MLLLLLLLLLMMMMLPMLSKSDGRGTPFLTCKLLLRWQQSQARMQLQLALRV